MTAAANRVRIVGLDSGLDVTLTITTKDDPEFGVDITEHPVEGGSPTVDHARVRLVKLSLEGVVTVFDDEGVKDESRSVAAYIALVGLAEAPQVVRIETPWRDYPEMLLERARPMRSKELGRALKIGLDFKQYKVTNTKKQTVEVRQAKKVKKGVKKADPVTPPRNVSLLKNTYAGKNAAGRALGFGQ